MQRVLVLDSFWQPTRIVSWERAVCMLWDQKAEVIEETEEILRSPSMQMHMPSVIRTVRKSKTRKTSIKFSRPNVLSRDGYQCQYCGGAFDAHELNYDHVVPRSHGGKTCWDNVVASCYPCNSRKADRTPEQAGMKLLRQPRKPAWLPIVTKRFDVRTIPESWRPYLQAA